MRDRYYSKVYVTIYYLWWVFLLVGSHLYVVMGWILSPKDSYIKILALGSSECALFGSKIIIDAIIKMRSPWSEVAPLCLVSLSKRKHGHRYAPKKDTMKRLESWCHTLRNYWKWGQRAGKIYPGSFRGRKTCQHLHLELEASRIVRQSIYCWSHLVCGPCYCFPRKSMHVLHITVQLTLGILKHFTSQHIHKNPCLVSGLQDSKW